jgi:hypothetical protein
MRIMEAVERLQSHNSPIARKLFQLTNTHVPAWLFMELKAFFPEIPWQRIPQKWKASVVERGGGKASERNSHFMVKELTGIDGPEELYLMVRTSGFSQWRGLNQRKYLIEVDLDEEPELVANSFEKWFREARNSVTGTHKMPTKTRKADLKALGAVRILRHFKKARNSYEDAIEESKDFTDRNSQSGIPIYSDSRDWHKAKARVEEVIAKLENKNSGGRKLSETQVARLVEILKKLGGASSGEPSAQ